MEIYWLWFHNRNVLNLKKKRITCSQELMQALQTELGYFT